jgi:RNA polymerase sigma factor (sigma-70 family)
VEASALQAPAGLARLGLSPPLLRLRSDDQLISLFRAGSDEAFSVIHDRYRQRLFAYVRQMLSASSRQDAEDVLQDVFVRAYGALRNDTRELNLRAWLYRVAHNRCVDHLRRPTPPAAEIFELSRKPLHDPMEEAQRREDLQRLVADVGRLPEQQRSALLMREIDGMAYNDISAALSVTVPAVKSLLVRARVGLVEAAEARDMDCSVIRGDLVDAYDRGVKASGRARRHMRECVGCREYRSSLRGMRSSFAALSPVGAVGPIAVAAKLFGLGGAAGGGTAAAGTSAGAVASGALAASGAATACKVAAAVVCTAALTAGGAVEVKRIVSDSPAPAEKAASRAAPSAAVAVLRERRAALSSGAATAPEPVRVHVLSPTPGKRSAGRHDVIAVAPLVEAGHGGSIEVAPTGEELATGGAVAPAEAPAPTLPNEDAQPVPPPADGQADGGAQQAPAAEEPAPGAAQSPGESGDAESSGGSAPPPQH